MRPGRETVSKQMAEKLLLVDDEAMLRETLALNLRSAGYEVVTAADGVAAIDAARNKAPDLVLLDLMLPEIDGLTVCRSIRGFSQVPIIMLTARTGELDKIVGLESGADDYLTKPFSIGELQARIRALLRRAGSTQPREEMRSKDLVLDLVSRRATVAGRELALSPKEFNLLAEMMRHPGSVLSRDLLMTRVWGLRVFGRQPHGRRACALAAREDRSGRGRAVPHRNGAGDRLPVRRIGLAGPFVKKRTRKLSLKLSEPARNVKASCGMLMLRRSDGEASP